MGFEYKILAKFTDKEITDIYNILEHHKNFDIKYQHQNTEHFEFRNIENQGKISNLFVTFVQDGIYICQNASSNMWTDLEELRTYLNRENIEYEILDYAD